jgi:hypothetical protein
MVSKAGLDRSIVDLTARMEAIQTEGREELRRSNVQIHSLTQAIVQQMNESRDQLSQTVAKLDQRFVQLETRLDNHSERTPDSTPQFILISTKKSPAQDGGSKQPMDWGSNRTDRYHLPRADCPSFIGDNTIEWVRKCTSYFEMHQVPDHLRTKLATNHFHDKASEWYDGYLMDHDPPDWSELVRLVRKRFNRQVSHNGMEELLELR